MRLWSLHPRYLDAAGLVAVWREALLAQKVLRGETRGYLHHPQLHRFKTHPQPAAAIASYLQEIWNESDRRGYHFDQTKIGRILTAQTIAVTRGQIYYEFDWLREKLKKRAPQHDHLLCAVAIVESHSLFTITPGEIEDWERIRHTPLFSSPLRSKKSFGG